MQAEFSYGPDFINVEQMLKKKNTSHGNEGIIS